MICVLIFAAGRNAKASILFDFEDQSYGSFSSISTSSGGLTATLYKTDSSSIDVQGPLPPASWLQHSLIAYSGSSPAPLVINFSSLVSNVSIQFGDFGGDDDIEIITAYSGLDGTGSILGINTVFYPIDRNISNGDSDVGTLAITASGIASVVITSGGEFPFSVYWDNLSVNNTAVPEPSALCSGLLSLVLGGAYSWRRRKSA